MALGNRRTERQAELWIAAEDLARTPRHVFYVKLNEVLAKGEFGQTTVSGTDSLM